MSHTRRQKVSRHVAHLSRRIREKREHDPKPFAAARKLRDGSLEHVNADASLILPHVAKLPSGYSYAWQNTAGQIHVTNDPTYDPNSDPAMNSTTWTRIQPVRR
jgi:hypothetical protein